MLHVFWYRQAQRHCCYLELNKLEYKEQFKTSFPKDWVMTLRWVARDFFFSPHVSQELRTMSIDMDHEGL